MNKYAGKRIAWINNEGGLIMFLEIGKEEKCTLEKVGYLKIGTTYEHKPQLWALGSVIEDNELLETIRTGIENGKWNTYDETTIESIKKDTRLMVGYVYYV